MSKRFSARPVLSGVAVLLLSGAFAYPSLAQNAPAAQAPAATSSSSSAATQPDQQAAANDATTYATGAPLAGQSKEGFWGHMNPFARKKWVNRQVDPIRDRENELDQLQAKNSRDIKDVDSRAQSGIANAMTAANTADQHAMDASNRANQAQSTATTAGTKTDALGHTVNNLDQYSAINSTDIPFAKGRTVLGPKGKSDLDAVAEQLNGQKGFIVEVEGFSHAGIQPSQTMADAVVRYLVTEHQVPVYRIYRTGMGKQTETASTDATSEPLTNGVRVTLMQNSLGTFNTNGAPSNNGAAAPSNPGVSSNTAPAAPGAQPNGMAQ